MYSVFRQGSWQSQVGRLAQVSFDVLAQSGPVSSGSIDNPSMCLRTFARVEGHWGPSEHGHSKFSNLVSPIGS